MEKNNEKNNKGFTLIELVIVVAVLAILVGLLAPSYTKYVKKSKVTKCEVQREEIERAYQIACIEDDILNGIEDTSTTSVNPIKRLEELGYFKASEAICPVYHENYDLVITTNKNRTKFVEVQCKCVNTLLSYIKTAETIFNDYDTDQKRGKTVDMIVDFYNKRGGFMEVSSSMRAGTCVENLNKSLYWRPYVLRNGEVVLYATATNDDSKSGWHAGWKACLLYKDGKTYECSQAALKDPNLPGDNISTLFKIDKNGEFTFEDWLVNYGTQFTYVEK